MPRFDSHSPSSRAPFGDQVSYTTSPLPPPNAPRPSQRARPHQPRHQGPWPPPEVLRTPEERFDGLEAAGYPFEPHYLELSNGLRVHYVDVGEANFGSRSAQETYLFLHGEPTWSFLYRKMIVPLSKAGHRCIAPDFIGFGRSDKYTKLEAYTHEVRVAGQGSAPNAK